MATKDFESVKAMVTALQPSYPVYCLRPEIIAETAKRFLDLFPGRVLYAVKCNPHPVVLKALYQAASGNSPRRRSPRSPRSARASAMPPATSCIR